MPERIAPNAEDRALVRGMLDRFLAYNKLWGNEAGLVLACQWHEEDPWVTAIMVARKLNVSDDTARRWLEELVVLDRAMVTVRSRRKFYKARDDLARQTTHMVRQSLAGLGEPQGG